MKLNEVRNGIYYRAEGKLDPSLTALARRGHSYTSPGGAFTPNEELALVYKDALPNRDLFALKLPTSIADEFYKVTITVAGHKGRVLDIPEIFRSHKTLIP